ncbi:MAG: DUF222 domain-containing protein [Propionicimonas sp.]
MNRAVALPAEQALATIGAVLDRIDSDRSTLAPESRLRAAEAARKLAARMDALASVLLAEADGAQASLRATGTPTSSWLAIGQNLSKRESAGLLRRAQELGQHPEVGRAAVAGELSNGQARAITTVVEALASQLDEAQSRQAERLLVSLAGELDSERLAKAAPRVLAEIAPQDADEILETRLQRQSEAAQRNRSLLFTRDNNGSARFSGSLPLPEAEAWLAILDAHQESRRRNVLEERDPRAVSPTPEQRRADALIDMIKAAQAERRTPAVGGDRPRVLVKLDYQALLRLAAGAGLIGEDEPLSAGDLRRLCCDADLIPTVLGSAGEVLDVGRRVRLVTPAIRIALTARDGGCAFPACHTRPAACEAHHITPWWAGGETSLQNLVLLCHHHHGLVEPAKYTTRDQWQVRMAADGAPEFIPPRRHPLSGSPLRHQRHGGSARRPPGG